MLAAPDMTELGVASVPEYVVATVLAVLIVSEAERRLVKSKTSLTVSVEILPFRDTRLKLRTLGAAPTRERRGLEGRQSAAGGRGGSFLFRRRSALQHFAGRSRELVLPPDATRSAERSALSRQAH